MLCNKTKFCPYRETRFWRQNLFPNLFPEKLGLDGNTPEHYGAEKFRFYWGNHCTGGHSGTPRYNALAETEGFEPSIHLFKRIAV